MASLWCRPAQNLFIFWQNLVTDFDVGLRASLMFVTEMQVTWLLQGLPESWKSNNSAYFLQFLAQINGQIWWYFYLFGSKPASFVVQRVNTNLKLHHTTFFYFLSNPCRYSLSTFNRIRQYFFPWYELKLFINNQTIHLYAYAQKQAITQHVHFTGYQCVCSKSTVNNTVLYEHTHCPSKKRKATLDAQK